MFNNVCYFRRGASELAKTTKNKKPRKKIKRPESRRGKEETRELLLEAAMELFAQKGYRGTSVRDLASGAGMTTGGFYSNFMSKRDIYIAIIDKITETVRVIVDDTVIGIIEVMKKRGGVRMEYELLASPINRLLDEASKHEALMHILRREGLGRDPDFQREIDRVWERFVDVMKRALDMYIEAGFARPYDTKLMARALLPAFIAMSLYDTVTDGRHREDIVSLLASMLHGGPSQWVAWQDLEKESQKTAGGSG